MKKLCFVLAAAILFTSFLTFGANASDYESDFPCGGVIEMVDAEFSRIPLKSRLSFGDSKPDLSGAIIEITYFDNKVESVAVEKNETGYSAGDFTVSFSNYGNVETEIFFGIKKVEAQINVRYRVSSMMEYEGTANYIYINFPSLF